MKKISILLTTALLASLSASAQMKEEHLVTKSIVDNSFISIGGGISGLYSPSAAKGFNVVPAPQMEVSFGKWFVPVWGGRIGLMGGDMAGYYDVNLGKRSPLVYKGMTDKGSIQEASFMYLHADLMLNWQNIFHVNPNRAYSLIPYVHVGGMLHYGTETAVPARIVSAPRMESFAFGAGLLNDIRLDDRVNLYADIRATMQNPQDNICIRDKRSILFSATVGLTYNLGMNKWIPTVDDDNYSIEKAVVRRSSTNGVVVNRRLVDNTFASAFGGLNIGRGVDAGYEPSFALAFGKWFGPYLGGRVEWLGGQIGGKEVSPHSFNYFHGDLLLNVNNLFSIKNDRIWTAMPYLHCGLSNQGNTRNPVKVGYGLLQSIRISKRFDLQIDAQYTALSRGSRDIAILAGVSYNLGRQGWDEKTIKYQESGTAVPNRWSVYTNLAGYVDGTFNVGTQYAFNGHWTADAELQLNMNTWGFEGRQNQRQLVSIGARWWPWCVYSGWWVKASGIVDRYHAVGTMTMAEDANIPERGDAYGLGLAGGYSLPLAKWFNLDFGVGMFTGGKSYAQYTDASFSTPVDNQWRSKAFIRLSDIHVSAVFVF